MTPFSPSSVRAAVPVAAALLLGPAPAAPAWELGGPLYAPRWDVPPSHLGFNLDETGPGYFGGGRYREFYNYGRGYGVANFPGPLPSPLRRSVTPHAATPPVVVPFAPAPESGFAEFVVRLPDGAELWIDGKRSAQTAVERSFVTPPLRVGERFVLEFRAKWSEGGRSREERREVAFRAGDRLELSFPAADPAPVLPPPRPFPLLETGPEL
jgi:uncharacterized protein (TIGR03000 family)